MNSLKTKLRKQGGFTLIEMLIVVALIAILVAVSIPLVSSSLEKAQRGTDAANERAAKTEIMMGYMAGATDADGNAIEAGDETTPVKYCYNAKDGTLKKGATATATGGDFKYGKCSEHKDGYIVASINKKGEVKLAWNGVSGGTTEVEDLCMDKVGTTN